MRPYIYYLYNTTLPSKRKFRRFHKIHVNYPLDSDVPLKMPVFAVGLVQWYIGTNCKIMWRLCGTLLLYIIYIYYNIYKFKIYNIRIRLLVST